uniref:Uncharacterized protein n=1 Tax=Rhizophora mucronata TaxID=61149 RepID=A0A2P2KM63_RHIMU
MPPPVWFISDGMFSRLQCLFCTSCSFPSMASSSTPINTCCDLPMCVSCKPVPLKLLLTMSHLFFDMTPSSSTFSKFSISSITICVSLNPLSWKPIAPKFSSTGIPF